MRLAQAGVSMIALAALSWCIGPGARAQTQPAKPAKGQAHHAKTAKAARAAADPAPSAARDPNPPAAPAAAGFEATAARRDPFIPLVNPGRAGEEQHLPPGKAGLVIATIRVEGAVTAPDGMIAVVANPQDRVYFIREGDHLYDGDVEKIGLDGVTFRENSKDAFGKPVERIVTRRIYAIAGDLQ